MEITNEQLAKFSMDFLSSQETNAESSAHLGGLVFELLKEIGGDHDEYMDVLTNMVLENLKEQLAT